MCLCVEDFPSTIVSARGLEHKRVDKSASS